MEKYIGRDMKHVRPKFWKDHIEKVEESVGIIVVVAEILWVMLHVEVLQNGSIRIII